MTIPNLTAVQEALIRDDPKRQHVLDAMSIGRDSSGLASLAEGAQIELLNFAARNLVEPLLAYALLQSHGSRAFATRARCTDVYETSERRIGILCDEQDRISNACDPAGVRIVALKNAGIARGLLTARGTCPMGDIDLLVRRDDFMAAHHQLLDLGYALGSRAAIYEADLASALPSGGAEYQAVVGGETVWVELQWRAVAGRWLRHDQEPNADDLVDRSVPIAGTSMRLLEPTDNLLQVCLHTAKHSYVRDPGLRLHTDVDRLVHLAPPSWGLFIDRVVQADVAHSVYFSLALAHALLATPIPHDVLVALAPPRWKQVAMWKWLARADVFEPQDQKFSRAEMLGFHGLMYDNARGLAASALDTEPDLVTWRRAPALSLSGARRMRDLVTRYQR